MMNDQCLMTKESRPATERRPYRLRQVRGRWRRTPMAVLGSREHLVMLAPSSWLFRTEASPAGRGLQRERSENRRMTILIVVSRWYCGVGFPENRRVRRFCRFGRWRIRTGKRLKPLEGRGAVRVHPADAGC